MAHHGPRVCAAAGDPAPGPEAAGAAPRAQQGERQGRARARAHHQRGVRVAGGSDGAARLGLGLEGRGPTSQTTGSECRAYLSSQSLRIVHCQPSEPRVAMRVSTDYIRHAARAARKCAGDPLGGAPQPPDPEFYKTLAKALEEIAAGLEQLGKEE